MNLRLILAFCFLCLSQTALAGNCDIDDILSYLQSSKVKINPQEDKGSIVYTLIDKKEKSIIGYLTGRIPRKGSKTIKLDVMYVQPWARKKGVHDRLLSELFTRHPEINRVSVETITMTNQDVVIDRLIAKAKEHPQFAAFNKGKKWVPDAEQAETLKNQTEHEYKIFELNQCCGNFFNHLAEKDPDQLKSMAREAFLSTPSYQGLEKHGFGKICRFEIEPFSEKRFSFGISFDVCK